MEPLIILVTIYLLAVVITRTIKKKWLFHFAGRITMSALLLFTAAGHFIYPDGIALMLPGFIPYKQAVIYLTGIIEILAATGLLIPLSKINGVVADPVSGFDPSRKYPCSHPSCEFKNGH
ncbi:MAG: hypothetical protein ACXWWC_10425 [Chitinophagaceae bacterium]